MNEMKQSVQNKIAEQPNLPSASLDIQAILSEGITFHQSGQLREAEIRYKQILSQNPDHADAMHLLGLLAGQMGNHPISIDLISKAIHINPYNPAYYNNLGNILQNSGRTAESISCYKQALRLKSDYASAACNLASAFKAQKKFSDALEFYQRAISIDSYYTDAHYNLGVTYSEMNQYRKAINCYKRAIELKPDFDNAFINLGIAYHTEGRYPEALACYQKALELNPKNEVALINMGTAYSEMGRFSEAINCFMMSAERIPNSVDAHFNLGNALQASGETDKALAQFHKVLQIDPHHSKSAYNIGTILQKEHQLQLALSYFRQSLDKDAKQPKAYNNMGNTLHALGRLEEAVNCFQAAIRIKPDFTEAYNNLGLSYLEEGEADKAIEQFQHAIHLKPDFLPAHNNLGTAFQRKGLSILSVPCFQKVLSFDPKNADAYCNLGNTLKDNGRIGEALAAFDNAITIKPESDRIHSNKIFALQYHPDIAGEKILQECRKWQKKFASSPLNRQFNNIPNPDRPLKIGYVSPDFRHHAAAYFLEPLFSCHNPSVFEVFCYSEVRSPDSMTDKLRALTDNWRTTAGVNDKELFEMILKDGIDIVIDCAGHSANNRIRSLALKPAPIQIATFLGHGGTTGLDAFDYFLSDPYLTPEGFESQFAEAILRLPHFFAPFRPSDDWPEVTPAPARKTKKIVFGYFAAPARIGKTQIESWKRILDLLPTAHLLLKNPVYTDSRMKKFWEKQFSFPHKRAHLEGTSGGWKNNMDVYSRVDILLDSFPVTGGTSTLIPLWMGLPGISLSGVHTGQRFGNTVLTNAGLSDLVAETHEEYITKAVSLARDIDRLEHIRKNLRQWIAVSPICDAIQTTREIEAAYRQVWQRWCKQQN